jgi:RND superfamily putative drug exporter
VIGSPARAIVRFRYLIIAFWIAVAGFAFPRASRVHDVLDVEGRTVLATEAHAASRLVTEEFPQPFTHFYAVTLEGPLPADSPAFQRALDTLHAAARRERYIAAVFSPGTGEAFGAVSPDGRAAFLLAAVAPEHADSSTDLTPAFRRAIHAAAARLPGSGDYTVHVTGAPALDFDIRDVSKADADRGERWALPLAGVVLVVAFGALVAAVLPILVGMFAITCSLALVHFASSFTPMSVFVLNIVTMIGLGVGIDYSLLIVTRFREELNRGLRRREAALRTTQTAGRAVVTSGLTVVVGFASLFVAPVMETRSVAIGGVIVVSIAVLLSVTLLPGVLAILGRAIDAPRALAKRLAWYHAPTGWERWARRLATHPWRALLLGLAAAAVVIWPLTGIRIGLPRAGWFPAGTESAAGVEALDRIGVRGLLQPVTVVVRAPEGEKVVGSRYLRGLRRLADSLSADPRVAEVRSAITLEPGLSILQYSLLYSNLERARNRYPDLLATFLSRDARTTRLTVILHDTTSITGSMDVVRRARAIRDAGIQGLEDTRIQLAGFQAASVDLQDELLRRFPILVALVLVITAIAMFVAFQSVLVPLKAVVMNCLSVAGAFGLIVLVFQHGIGAGWFGLDGPTEAIFVLVPVLVFAVVFGLSMDYEVFLLARIKEAFDRSGRNSQATMEGLSATASVITSAAFIMMIVFGVFSFSDVLAIQLFGFGLAAAVALDATLVRMVLVPAFMHIAGRWNWWPGVRDRGAAPVVEQGSGQTPRRPDA